MKIVVTGKKLDIGEALRSHIEDSLGRLIGKYFGDAIETDVVISREGRSFRVDISVHIGRSIYVRSHDIIDDPYAAFDMAAAHVAKRLRRYKRRLRDHHGRANTRSASPALQYVLAEAEHDTATHADEDDTAAGGGDDNPVIIAEIATEIEPLSVSEAVMRMDLADQPAFMFRNPKTGELNVIYRRNDGNIGWIDPQPE